MAHMAEQSRVLSRAARIGGCAFAALAGAALLVLGGAPQAQPDPGATPAILLDVDGAIGPATTEYLSRGLADAAEQEAPLVIIRLDTPGGLTAATRDIVKAIRNSPVPVATWVAPEGARAASAGTYILYASHVAAMAPATNVGAATPVSLGGAPASPPSAPEKKPDQDAGDNGEGSGKDQAGETESGAAGPDQADEPADSATASRRKAVNDAAAWIRSLAEETGRNAEWAERAVREGVSVTAEEALELGVAEVLATNVRALLDAIDGREVTTAAGAVTLHTDGIAVERREPGWRSELLAVITNPTVAYILLMIGFYGLLLEGYNPGAIVPGTVGAICLLLALYALQVLPVNYAGLLLILLGLMLMVAEAFAPSFGALGIGGVVAFVAGSVILMDTDVPGFEIAIEVIGGVALVASVLMGGLVLMAIRAFRRPVLAGAEEIEGGHGEAMTPIDNRRGEIWIRSERWQARSDTPINKGEPVRVTGRDGLILQVEPQVKAEE